MTENQAAPRLLYVSTLDRIIGVMLPHLDTARTQGWQVEIACRPTILGDDIRGHADRFHPVALQRFPLHPQNFGALLQLIHLIEEGKFTVVHCHNPTGGFVGRLAATLANRRLSKRGLPTALRVYTAHGFHFHRHGGRVSNLIYRAAETIAGRFWSDAVLTITQEDYDAALRYRVAPPQKVFLTGGVGVSARDDFNPERASREAAVALRREINVAPHAPIVTMVGEMVPRKRHADALKAWTHIREHFPAAHLILVGDGKLSDSLQSLAHTLGIDHNVHFLGFRRDIQTILSASDVFLFPSGQEGLPCAIQEALSMAVPTVATDVRGNRDLVDRDCGRIVPLGDITALAGAVCELLALPPEQRHSMGQQGRKKMLASFDRARCVQQWQEIYEGLLNPPVYRDKVFLRGETQ